MPLIVPDMTTRLLRGEMPEIVEVTHDPTRGWLEPEFESVADAALSMFFYLDGLMEIYKVNPFLEKQERLCEELRLLWIKETPCEDPF